MSPQTYVNVPVSPEMVAAIKAGNNGHDPELLEKASKAVVDAIKDLPLDLDSASSSPDAVPPSTTSPAHIPILPPADLHVRLIKLDRKRSFDIRVITGMEVESFKVSHWMTMRDFAQKVKTGQSQKGYLVLDLNEGLRIYDERWGSNETAAFERTLRKADMHEWSLVIARLATNID